ncbi:ATP phosphoribosyltransferase regulatory subunit [Chloroflexota bacterium]
MKIPRTKGTRDWSPEEMAQFRLIEDRFRNLCLKWGYQEVRTPTIESLHLFTSAGTLTPGMLNRVYSFLDWDGWSGERVVLRPDGTIPIARLYTDSMSEKGLARLFYISNIFIFEETGTETREKWQCGTELIGAGLPLADTELVSLAMEILASLGIKDVQLRLSHAGLIKALLAKLGLDKSEQTAVFDRILDGDIATLAEIKSGNPELESILPSLLNHKGRKSGFLNNLKAITHIPELKPHLDNFMNIVNYLESLDCNYQIDIASGAGFEYYTGLIFQFYAGNKKIGGGGRYDDLISAMGGKVTPACGFAFYIDRMMKLIQPGTGMPARILVSTRAGESVPLKDILQASRQLHEAGYRAEIELTDRKPEDLSWLLEIKGGGKKLILTNLKDKKSFAAKDTGDVLRLLEAEDADKNRSA